MRRVALLVGAMLAALVALSGVATISEAAGGDTTRVSVDSSGVQGNSMSLSMGGKTFISADGPYVAFTSQATNLVPGDTNDTYDVFVHEFEPDTTALRVVRTVPDEGAMDVPRASPSRPPSPSESMTWRQTSSSTARALAPPWLQ